MPFTQADIDALKAAIAKGEEEVVLENRRVRYRSVPEMREALALMELEVAAQSSTSRPRIYYGAADKGL